MKKELKELSAKSRDEIVGKSKEFIVESLREAAADGRFGASFVRKSYSYSNTTGYSSYTLPNVSQKEINELVDWVKSEHKLDIEIIRDTFDGHRGAKHHINHGFTISWED